MDFKEQHEQEINERPEYIQLRVVDQDQKEVLFRLKKTSPLKSLKRSFCERVGRPFYIMKFLFDGSLINDNHRPMDLDMEQDDMIEVSEWDLGLSEVADTKDMEEKLSRSLIFFEKRELTDVVVICGETEEKIRIPCHKLSLATSSGYFARMLGSAWDEGEVEIKEFEREEVEALIKFCYTNEVDEKALDGKEIIYLKMADMFEIPKMMKYVENVMKSKLTKRNAVEILGAANNFNAGGLKVYAIKFIVENKMDLSTIPENWENAMKDADPLLFELFSVLAGDTSPCLGSTTESKYVELE